MHPASRRCSSVTCARHAPSSRLAIRAPRHPEGRTCFLTGPNLQYRKLKVDTLEPVHGDVDLPHREAAGDGPLSTPTVATHRTGLSPDLARLRLRPPRSARRERLRLASALSICT